MEYRFILNYVPTDPDGVSVTQEVRPIYGEDLAVEVAKESDEWYYKRKMSGKLVFVREDYGFIMGCAFDGTFTLTVRKSTDGGHSWQDYFTGSFSRASLEIDVDNQTATLDGLEEGVYAALENGKSEEYDLRKLIPDGELKTIEGEVHPALAMVDYRSENIEKSDIYCGSSGTAGGYKSENGWSDKVNAGSNTSWNLIGVYAEANVKMTDGNSTEAEGHYVGKINYQSRTEQGHTVTSVNGNIYNDNGCYIQLAVSVSSNNYIYIVMRVFDSDGYQVTAASYTNYTINDTGYFTPASLSFSDFGQTPFERIDIFFHYIRATLVAKVPMLTLTGLHSNVLDMGAYYKYMRAFNNSDGGLEVTITSRTVETPNGHRLVTGTGERGEAPQYFAPPADNAGWIPLAEDNWNYGSMWYKIEPSVENGLLNRALVGTFRWQGWTVGTCLRYLLEKITQGKVTFEENVDGSRFLYESPNPVNGGEPFEYLVTQKSNVMHPSAGGESAARCVVRLDWFLELLRNAFNCYYWLDERNDGYVFRLEHVEFFRKGHKYQGDLETAIDITAIKTRKNLFRNNAVVKRLVDQTNKYTFDMKDMAEKYIYKWQGDGGSDDFKGHPMYFKAGWVEKAKSESKEVDNIFADLDWLMLNAGTDTASSKNYDGLFLFAGYKPYTDIAWVENMALAAPVLMLYTATPGGRPRMISCDMWVTIPEGQTVTLFVGSLPQQTFTGTGMPQGLVFTVAATGTVTLNFGAGYANVTLHRIHAADTEYCRVPNVDNLLRADGSTIQNGPLAWPWLQNAYLHYDVPAQRWSFDSDDIETATFVPTGTIKLCKKQTIGVLPMPSGDPDTEKGVKTGIGTGIIETATVNLGTRNCKLTLMHEIQ